MSSRVIHLDQKDWIELARGYYGRVPGLQRIAKNVVEKSESGLAIFPLPITHLDETVRNLNPKRRQRLAKYMMLVSHRFAILPATQIVSAEIRNACRKVLSLPKYDLQKFAIKKGISQLVGAKATLVDRDPSHPLPQELKEQLLEKTESPEALFFGGESARAFLKAVYYSDYEIGMLGDLSRVSREQVKALLNAKLQEMKVIEDVITNPREFKLLGDATKKD